MVFPGRYFCGACIRPNQEITTDAAIDVYEAAATPPRSRPKKKFWRRKNNSSKTQTDSLKDDCPPLYASLDIDSAHVNYAAIEPSTSGLRYDYPVFRPKHRNFEESLYANASQTCSIASEDPYSSIASGVETSRNVEKDSIGYAKVTEDQLLKRSKTSTDANDVEEMYAKVNRTIPIRKLNVSPKNIAPVQVAAIPEFDHGNEESGSGSIMSAYSTNPSYRYLTARESLTAIRERLRQRNEETIASVREHYYATIQNDYESVKDFDGVRTNDQLVIDTSPNTAGRSPPRPPTSPVPNRTSPGDGPNASPSELPTMVRNSTRKRPYLSSAEDIGKSFLLTHRAQSTELGMMPIVISMPMVLQKGESLPEISNLKVTDRRSKIPLLKKKRIYCQQRESVPKVMTTSHPPIVRRKARELFVSSGRDYREDLPTSIVVTNVPKQLFGSEELKKNFESLFAELCSSESIRVDYFKSFQRIRVSFTQPEFATAAKVLIDHHTFEGVKLTAMFLQNIKLTKQAYQDEQGYLTLPPLEKQFLISPPASPPVGWTQSVEMAPVICDFDLMARLAAYTMEDDYELHGGEPDQPSIIVTPCQAKDENSHDKVPLPHTPRPPRKELHE